MTTTLSTRRRLGAVFIGGFCGTVTRYLLSLLIQGWVGKGWPVDILLINLTGALLLACVTTLADATFLVGPTRRLFINVGFLGAYTTFSSLALGDVLLTVGRQWVPALLYLACSLFGGMGAAVAGDLLGLAILRAGKQAVMPKETVRRAQERGPFLSKDNTVLSDHVDIDDDLLLPEMDKGSKDELTRFRGGDRRKKPS